MKFVLPRAGVASLVALALAACSGQSVVPSSSSQSMSPDFAASLTMRSPIADTLSADAKSPCSIKGFWFFGGACVATNLTAKGGSVTLAPFKGVGSVVSFGPNNAPGKVGFLVSDGTSSKDITGTFNSLKFPDFGTVPCVSLAQKIVKCVGTPFFYTFAGNFSKSAVAFAALPGAVITDAKFPGKTCGQGEVAFNSAGQAAWFILPGAVKPKGGKATFPGFKNKFTFNPNGFTVIAYYCH
jgi:hypothetical protein